MVFEYVDKFGLQALVVLGLVTGLIQISAGYFKLGKYFRAVPPALVKGMLGGIGALILASQLHVGLNSDPGSNGLKNILSLPNAFIGAATEHQQAAIVLITSLAIMLLWPKIASGARVLKRIPAPLVGVIAMGFIATMFFKAVPFVSLPENIMEGLSLPSATSFEGFSFQMVAMAVGIAFIASVETLLSASAVDRLSKRNNSNYDRELMAQGVGNSVAGLLGALPITGVIVRSSANVASGGKSWQSAFMHGVWLALLVFMLPQILNYIPIAALAAILVITGIKLLDIPGIIRIWKTNKGEFLVYSVTLGVIVSFDLLTGVLAGFATSLIVLLWETTKFDIQVNKAAEETTLTLKGKASFLHIPKIADALPKSANGAKIVVDLSNTDYVDQAVREQLESWVASSEDLKKMVTICFPTEKRAVRASRAIV